MMAGPAPSAGPVSATPAAGQLPAYASDLRPTISAATTPAALPSSPLSATPGSAPVHPSAGQGSPAQPAVVRQATARAQPSGASSLGTQAAAATTTGAVAGAASDNATARARLQRLVGAVARQQPRLAWAIGDRADNSTVLATDLASGWIPPGIELPAGVTLLPPNAAAAAWKSCSATSPLAPATPRSTTSRTRTSPSPRRRDLGAHPKSTNSVGNSAKPCSGVTGCLG